VRILQIGGPAGPGGIAGGVWSVASVQSQALKQSGHEVQLIGGWLGAPPAQGPGRSGRLFRLHRPFPGAGLRGLISFRMVHWVRRNASKFDVIHIHLARDFITTFSLLALKGRGVPVVVQTHGMFGPSDSRAVRAFDALFRRRIIGLPLRWLSFSAEETTNLRALGIAAERIIHQDNAVADSRTRWAPTAPPTFSFVSRLHPRKQADIFVAAALILLNEGRAVKFVIAGPDQGSLQTVLTMTRNSPHASAIEVVGSIGLDEVRQVLAKSTALVLPSRGEIYPMIVLEAASVGTPVILTDDSAISELLSKGASALVGPPTKEFVAEAMRSLLDSPHLTDILSVRSRAMYEALWTPERLAESLGEHYNLLRSSSTNVRPSQAAISPST
jgi:glycosyltransferase involved in cell wall biosynthesis